MPTDLAVAFPPEMLAFERSAYALRDDLARLLAVRDAGAGEAVVLYAVRILDALAAEALVRAALPVTGSLYSNLNRLQLFHLLPGTLPYWAHTLRRLGNDVRHLRRALGALDAELAMACCARVRRREKPVIWIASQPPFETLVLP